MVLGLAQNSGYLCAACWADTLSKAATVGNFDIAGEASLLLAFNAVGLTCV